MSAVAVGWSGYAVALARATGSAFPHCADAGARSSAASVNLPAIFIIAVVAGLLIYGTRESATLNAMLVVREGASR